MRNRLSSLPLAVVVLLGAGCRREPVVAEHAEALYRRCGTVPPATASTAVGMDRWPLRCTHRRPI
jgi:hypothetical protein